MATQVVIPYAINVFAPSQAAMHTAVAAVPLLIPGELGVTLLADSTANVGAEQVTRTLTLSLIQPPTVSVHNPPLLAVDGLPPPAAQNKYNWTGTIVSTSDQDGPGGTGAKVVTVSYTDAAGGAHSNSVTLTGRTPVTLPTSDHSTITSVVLAQVGSSGSSVGQLTIKADPIPGGNVSPPGSPALPQPPPVVCTVPPGYVNLFAPGADLSTVFKQLFRGQLEQALETPVLALTPVVS